MTHYDAIIIGGRPAGASLAVHLARGGMTVLVVDRATFPSKPAIPSMPLILPHTLDLLDEIGIPESVSANAGSKLLRLLLEMNGHYAVEIDFGQAMAGDSRRPYFYSIRRDPFDNALWENLSQFDNITARQEFGVTKLLTDDAGKVTGIEGANGEQITADVVVGADGRFSFVANQVNAAPFNEVSDYNTDFYFAYWRGGTYDHEDWSHTMHVYSSTQGYQYLIFPVSDNEVAVSVQMVHDLFPKPANQSIEDYYEAQLQKYPQLWHQIQGAERISQVWGMKNIRNGYREVGGNGWVLVGDAAHYKDSIDGQGIYDALLGAKILAAHLIDWKAGKHSWEAAVEQYRAALLDATYDMFMETQGRLKREVHDEPPQFVVTQILRRVMEDPTYQKQFIGYATRRFEPKGWASPQLMLEALVRGFGRDLRKLFS
ncbi:MAG: NAD(P)/FAD-dependent oxidoreductase [Anaerolineae bacterium]|nr:NAD(P)/FAD-dependent oxidoreductase [Anaerolineae bacterium]